MTMHYIGHRLVLHLITTIGGVAWTCIIFWSAWTHLSQIQCWRIVTGLAHRCFERFRTWYWEILSSSNYQSSTMFKIMKFQDVFIIS